MKYRNNGAVGALLDEYEKSVKELCTLIEPITTEELTKVIDAETKDEDCRSIQSILSHVVSAGHNYVNEIRNWKGEEVEYAEKIKLQSTKEYISSLIIVISANEKLFADYPNIKLEENKSENKIKSRWGQIYDVEQLMEHAIVHILRHRRQIERFLLSLKKHN